MITIIMKSGRSLSKHLETTVQVVSNGMNYGCLNSSMQLNLKTQTMKIQSAMGTYIPIGKINQTTMNKTGNVQIQQINSIYTNFKVPDFSEDRRDSTNNPEIPANKSIDKRRVFTYLLVAANTLGFVYGTKVMVQQSVLFFDASADVLALAKIEIKLNDIPEGRSVSFKWRGAPLFIKHRTDKEIKCEQSVPLNLLRDPETDEQRCSNPKWLVVKGICTHLGCVPISEAGDFPGGYYCPCHGSHFDAAGRVRKGPAPINLEIPKYTFHDNNTLIVG